MASVSVLAQPPALAPAPPSMYAAAPPVSMPMLAPIVPPPPPAQAQAQDYFAFARIADDVCLVQAPSTPLTPLTPVAVKIFRHEFISIFRLSEARTLHPADIRILERIDARRTRYEEDSGTVFLARDVMARLSVLSRPSLQSRPSWSSSRNSPRRSPVPRSSLKTGVHGYAQR